MRCDGANSDSPLFNEQYSFLVGKILDSIEGLINEGAISKIEYYNQINKVNLLKANINQINIHLSNTRSFSTHFTYADTHIIIRY